MAQQQDGGTHKYSIICIVASSLTAGSLYTYPIYSSSLQSKLNFSPQQVSITASIGILTQYLCAAFWGSLADKHGPARLSLIAAVLFFLGYSPLSYSLINPTPPSIDHPSFHELGNTSANFLTWIHVTVAYALCGAATTASYFAALTSSTTIFGSSRPALSVAGPSTLFGLSPLILSYVGVKFFTRPDDDDGFDSTGYLGCLAILTTLVNLMGSIGLSCKPLSTRAGDLYYDEEPDERAPLVQISPSQIDSSTLSKSSRTLEAPKMGSLRGGTREFLRSPTVWLLGMVVLLSAGPAEMTISSIGLVVDSVDGDTSKEGMKFKANQVQLISLTNTISRLVTGWTSDRFCSSGSSGSRLAIWATGCFIYSLICFSFAYHPSFVPLLSTITGCFYGMIFTLAPSLVATVWSISSFGRNYGIISYFSATGSFLFTFLFGMIVTNPTNGNSIAWIYRLSGFTELVSISIIYFLYRFYWIHHHHHHHSLE